LVATVGCDQRRVSCAVRSDDFAVKYLDGKVVSGMGDCGDALSFETAGFFTHVAALNPTGKLSSISVRPSGTGEIAQAATTEVPVDPTMPDGDTKPIAMDKVATHSPTSVGMFGSLFPDSSDLCTVPTLSPAEVEYDTFTIKVDTGEPPAGDGGVTEGGVTDGGTDGGVTEGGTLDTGAAEAGLDVRPPDAAVAEVGADVSTMEVAAETAAPVDGGMCPMPGGGDEPPTDVVWDATHVRYQWSNLKIYVTAGITGGIVSGDLTYTTFNGPTEACKATYKVRAVSPVIDCADECGKPVLERCYTDANGKPTGLSRDIKVECDPDHLVCVLSDDDKHVP
jgi:hypothetical protein